MTIIEPHFWNPESHPAAMQQVKPLRVRRSDGGYLFDNLIDMLPAAMAP